MHIVQTEPYAGRLSMLAGEPYTITSSARTIVYAESFSSSHTLISDW